jgi:hypothetical protein
VIKLVWVKQYSLTGYHPESLKYHKTGKYIPKDNDTYNEKNEGITYSKCSLVLDVNPYGLYSTTRLYPYILMRQDIADKIASPCKHCYPKGV